MWICSFCKQKFINNNQVHSCNDKVLDDFLLHKSAHTLDLFWNFINHFQRIGNVPVHPTKSMIALAAKKRIAYIIRLGLDFIDVVFPFQQPYNENLCFHKIVQVPGTSQYNHHLRITNRKDINAEVKQFMKLAYKEGQGE